MFSFQNGKKFMYETGQWLRKRYDDFLGKNYVPDVSFFSIINKLINSQVKENKTND